MSTPFPTTSPLEVVEIEVLTFLPESSLVLLLRCSRPLVFDDLGVVPGFIAIFENQLFFGATEVLHVDGVANLLMSFTVSTGALPSNLTYDGSIPAIKDDLGRVLQAFDLPIPFPPE